MKGTVLAGVLGLVASLLVPVHAWVTPDDAAVLPTTAGAEAEPAPATFEANTDLEQEDGCDGARQVLVRHRSDLVHQLGELNQRLEAIDRELDQVPSTPIDWPEGMARDEVRGELEDLLQAWNKTFPDHWAELDCAEYPCIMVVPGGSHDSAVVDLKERLKAEGLDYPVAHSSLGTDGRELGLAIASHLDEAEMARAGWRLRQAFIEQWERPVPVVERPDRDEVEEVTIRVGDREPVTVQIPPVR